MDFIISPKNALVLDRLMKTIKSTELVIDTTSKILFQMVSEDRTRCCNLSLDTDFFISVKLKRRIFQIVKPKFFIKKMKVLRMFTYENVVVLEYEFEDYVYRHRLFTYETSIYTLNFNSQKITPLDQNLFLEVLKQLKKGETRIRFEEDYASLRNEENTVRFRCCGFEGVSFDLCLPTFKLILNTCKGFTESYFCWEDEGCPINLLFKSPNLQVSFFLAV